MFDEKGKRIHALSVLRSEEQEIGSVFCRPFW